MKFTIHQDSFELFNTVQSETFVALTLLHATSPVIVTVAVSNGYWLSCATAVVVVGIYTEVIAVAFVTLVVIVSFNFIQRFGKIPVTHERLVQSVVAVSHDTIAEYHAPLFLSI